MKKAPRSPVLDPSDAETTDGQDVDFSADLIRAAENAPLIEVSSKLQGNKVRVDSEVSETSKAISELQALPDETTIISPEYEDGPGMVSTTNRSEYPTLLRQAWSMLPEKPDRDPEAETRENYDHEIEHADEMLRVVPDATIHYGVKLARGISPDTSAEQIYVQPYVSTDAPMRKIDTAAVIAAPTTLSQGDIASIRALGYESAEEVGERRVAVDEAMSRQLGQTALEENGQG